MRNNKQLWAAELPSATYHGPLHPLKVFLASIRFYEEQIALIDQYAGFQEAVRNLEEQLASTRNDMAFYYPTENNA